MDQTDLTTTRSRYLELLPDTMRVTLGRRATGIVVALALEVLLLILLLSLGWSIDTPKKPEEIKFDFQAKNYPSEDEKEDSPEPKQQPQAEPQSPVEPVPQPEPVVEAPPVEKPPIRINPRTTPAPAPPPPVPQPTVGPRPIQPTDPNKGSYGPPSSGQSGPSGDSQVVGTAPNGEPLYAARWYREPRHDELSGYLSTASGPGWGLIACRTAPDFRVEDCVPLAESPQGSQINRAILAAAWQFKVRPPSKGGQSMVGAWVRIRIDYSVQPRTAG